MPWNPSPKVADCREIARKWGADQVIVLALDGQGRLQMATFGKTTGLCGGAKRLGDVAFDAIMQHAKNGKG